MSIVWRFVLSIRPATRSRTLDGDSATAKPRRSRWLIVLAVLVLLQGLSGLLGGIGLVLDPRGEGLGMELSMLKDTPFDSFLVPGLILFFILGVFPVVTFVGLLKRSGWAFGASLCVGFGLVIWIGVQISMIGYSSRPPLQAIYGGLGVVIVALTLTARLRRQLGNETVEANDYEDHR